MSFIINPYRYASGGDDYAIGGFSPEWVLDFVNLYWRYDGTTRSWSDMGATHNSAGLMTMHDNSGNLVWGPHNLYANSDSPASQSITVENGAQYTMKITGSGSIGLTGATTATVTAASPQTFTASSTTLTCATPSGTVNTAWCYRSDLGGMSDWAISGSDYVENTTSSPIYSPRFGHYIYMNGTAWENKGYLAEEGQGGDTITNELVESNDLTTSWTATNASPSTNYATSPTGQTDCCRLIDDAGSGTGDVYVTSASITISGATDYVFSAYAKSDQLTFLRMETINSSAGSTWFNLSTGAVGTASGNHIALIQDMDNGWYRCSVTITSATPDTSIQVRLAPADADNDSTMDLDGTSSILIYGAQFENAENVGGPRTPSSYIPTNGSTASRSTAYLEFPLQNRLTKASATALSQITWATQSHLDLNVNINWGPYYYDTASGNDRLGSYFMSMSGGRTGRSYHYLRTDNTGELPNSGTNDLPSPQATAEIRNGVSAPAGTSVSCLFSYQGNTGSADTLVNGTPELLNQSTCILRLPKNGGRYALEKETIWTSTNLSQTDLNAGTTG